MHSIYLTKHPVRNGSPVISNSLVNFPSPGSLELHRIHQSINVVSGAILADHVPCMLSADLVAVQSFVAKLGNGAAIHYKRTDVTNRDEVFNVIGGIAKEHGRLDVCAAVAGILGIADGEDCWKYSESAWKKVLDVSPPIFEMLACSICAFLLCVRIIDEGDVDMLNRSTLTACSIRLRPQLLI